jgi:hypothetical protein
MPDKILFFVSKDSHEGRLLQENCIDFAEESITATLYVYFSFTATRFTIVDVKKTFCALLTKALVSCKNTKAVISRYFVYRIMASILL